METSALLTGLCIGLATLTNLYPILLLLVVVYRRSWSWLFICTATCVITIVLGYLPYIILGQGRVLGFFSTFASEQTIDAGPLMLMVRWLGEWLHMGQTQTLLAEYVVDLLVVLGVALTVVWLRWRGKMRATDATLLFIAAVLVASTHIHPWYNTALIPWVVFMAGPLRHRAHGWNVRGWVALAAWYFSCLGVTSYYFYSSSSLYSYYYIIGYDIPVLLLLLAILLRRWQQATITDRSGPA